MRMTIDEIIAKEKEIAQDFQKTIDTHITSHNFSLEEMYCDDTEVIEDHLQRCKALLDYHNQIANTMSKYQKIEQIANGNFDNAYSNIAEIRRIVNGNVD